MGNAQVSKNEEPRMLLTEFNYLVYQDVLGSYKLFKVMQCVHEREGLLVVKLFIHREGAPNLYDVKQKIIQVRDAFRNQWLYPNVVPYQGMEINSRSAILLRQHFARNLYDRMHTRPFLTDLTKNWIAFQVLCSVCQAHSVGVAHCDLKTENIFVSSWNHAVLSDFALFKPLFLPEDDPSEFSFFFESNLNRRRCYLAPERFDTAAGRSVYAMHEIGKRFSRELAAMDVFSLGCVLAELFLDGQTLMDLPELLLYRANQLDLHAKISGIKNPVVQELLRSMLHRDPTQRRPAIEYLREWCEKVAPPSFAACLFPLSVLLLHPVYQQPDMRVVLLRHNFAHLMWSIVGARKIRLFTALKGGDVAGSTTVPAAGGPETERNAAVWERWARHVKRTVRLVDDATMHSTVHTATLAASQWATEPSGGAASSTAGGDLFAFLEETAASADVEAADDYLISSSLCPSLRLTQPVLREPCCERFTKGLLDHWEEGYRRRTGPGHEEMDEWEEQPANDVYSRFLTELCSHSAEMPMHAEASANSPHDGSSAEQSSAEHAEGGRGVVGFAESEDVLSILCAFICSSLQYVSNPRLKIVCLDMLEQMAPFTSQGTVLEQIIPYVYVLMTDPAAKVRARAIDVLTQTLERIEQLPSSDTPLFMEYIFPQLHSAISDMNSEPMMLLAIARNIGALAQHALRFAELSIATAQRASSAAISASPAGTTNETPKQIGIEAFDVQRKHLQEAVKKVVKALLEYSPVGPELTIPGGQEYEPPSSGMQEESLLNLTMGREIKIALLRNMCVLADIFGRDGTHSFLLPYLITFMNDASWEVRAAFCEEAARLPRKAGQVSADAEGIIWPCYEQALLDPEEHVLKAALRGLAVLVSQQVLRRQSLQTVASKVAPLLVHPSGIVRARAVAVLDALEVQLSPVDQFVFVVPLVRPFLRLEVPNLREVGPKLVHSLGRRIFKRAMLNRDDELCDALLHKKPLPAISEVDSAEDGNVAERNALELFRPYLHSLLRSRPALAQMTGAGSSFNAMCKDEHGVFIVPPTIIQSLQYATVNPHCAANRSLQALAELDDGPRWPCAAPADLHPLCVFSMQSFLVQALCLPPQPRNLGSLSYLDGTPYSLYAASMPKSRAGEGSSDIQAALARSEREIQDSAIEKRMSSDFYDSPELSGLDITLGTTVSGLPGVAAMASSDRASRLLAPGSQQASRQARSGSMDVYGLDLDPESDYARSSACQPSWRPRGVLLATLYEYVHQNGAPVVKVDTTDDSRILVTGGKDGVVKLWNCPNLASDVAVSSSMTFSIPCDNNRRRQRLRALRTVRNSKAFTVGSESGDVFLYRVEPSRGSVSAAQVCRLSACDKRGACSVMCIEQFDTELESLVVFAQQNGKVHGWDVRSHSPSWTVSSVPPWLGVPSSLALGSDGHAVIVGTLGGGLLMYDLRFLAPWKQWKVSSGAAVLSLRSAHHAPSALCARSASAAGARAAGAPDFSSSPGVFVALGSDSNEVAFFDVLRGSCLTLFLTEPVGSERQREAAVSVPSLLDAEVAKSTGQATLSPEKFQANLLGGRRPSDRPNGPASPGCVRSLWLPPPRGAQTFLLAGGTDRKVRHWSLDPEHHTTEAYVVTPQESVSAADRSKDRVTYNSNHLGDVFVVQEQSASRGDTASRGVGKSNLPGAIGMSGAEESRQKGPNPNHRDAILDMCTISLQHDILVTAGRDGLVKLWK